MRINFKPKNQEEVFSILLFYWAYWWRACLWGTLIVAPVAALYFALLYNSASISLMIFLIIAILPLAFLIVIVITLYVFRKLACKKFKTFSVKWTMPEPQSLFERGYIKKVLIYLGVSMLSGIIVSTFLLLSVIFQAFLFYLFVKNEWLPFVIEAKEEDVNLAN